MGFMGRAFRDDRIGQLAIGAAVCSAPVSIAISESFLAIGVCWQVARIASYRETPTLPAALWFWLAWACLEVVAWLHSPEPGAGKGEIRHLALIGTLFMTLPSLDRLGERVRVWRVIFVTATFGSATLIVGFLIRLVKHRHELATGGDAAFYLRSGGLLHHWMIYATVEVLVFGALLEFRAAHAEERRWLTVALAVNSLAVLVSLTRCLWLACFIVFALHLAWRRSKWLRVLPAAPLVLALVPGPVHQRVTESLEPEYYSNAERVQMWRVGWHMIREHPVFGVGPGRVEELYTQYLPLESLCRPIMGTFTTTPLNWPRNLVWLRSEPRSSSSRSSCAISRDACNALEPTTSDCCVAPACWPWRGSSLWD